MDVAERHAAAWDEQNDLQPLRGESFSAEHLEVHFQQLAQSQVIMPRNWAGRDFSSQFERHAAGIIKTHARVTDSLQAASWFAVDRAIVPKRLIGPCTAAWLYRVMLESLLGLSVDDGSPSLNPRVPEDWASFQIVFGQRVITWQREESDQKLSDRR